MALVGPDNSAYDPVDRRPPLILERTDFQQVTDDVVRPIFDGPPKI